MRRGRFEQAEGGTLFLDEIGDMPADLQTRLLRVLSDGSSTASAATSRSRRNVRVIAATHQNLEQRVREGTFREDLYHRLNVIRLRLPQPARARAKTSRCSRKHFLAKSAQAARRRAQAPRATTRWRISRAWNFPATCASSRTSATGSR